MVAKSSANVDYQAIALTTYKLVWLKHLLKELKFCKIGPRKLIGEDQTFRD